MADVKLSVLLDDLRGNLGDVVFKKYGDRIILTKKPDFEDYEPSEAQQSARNRFREANAYAKAVMADPEALAKYDHLASQPDTPRIQNLLISDYMSDPEITAIDTSHLSGSPGNTLTIHAEDKYEVLSVEVVITQSDTDTELERGPAEYDSNNEWIYHVTNPQQLEEASRVTAIAKDRPGNTAKHSIEI